ncbi:FAD-dependent oxidoreductase, partial [Vibrio parahaemolyticus]
APGGAVEGIVGGMSRLVDALVARLGDLGAELRTGVAVTGLAPRDGGWTVHTDDEPLDADAVIVALPEG